MLAGVIKREHLDKKFGKLGINRREPDSWSHIQQKKIDEHTTMTNTRNVAFLLVLWIFVPSMIKG